MTEEADLVIPASTKVRPDKNLPTGCVVIHDRGTFTAVCWRHMRNFETYNEALAWAQMKGDRRAGRAQGPVAAGAGEEEGED